MTRAARDFGHVGVLMGGWSSERAISLDTGGAVTAALRRSGVTATACDVTRASAARLGARGFERAFIALHGRGGEDGAVQGLLEVLGIAYTGSGVLASATCMDKVATKRLWDAFDLPTPAWLEVDAASDAARVVAALGLPLALKPRREGSSIGVAKVARLAQWAPALREAARFGDVIAERWIEGSEYAVALLGTRMLAPIRLEPARPFYDYVAKYEDDATRYHCPCGLSAAASAKLQALCRRACDVLEVRGWARVDVMGDASGAFHLLEVNTVPGMTGHSLVPMAAAAEGIGFDELALEILRSSEEVRDE